MKAVELKPNVFWVGAVDWDLRYFHGYLTPRGTTYNSYLIMDEKIVLVDTVKSPFFEEMLGRIKTVVDPARISCLIVNHVEMDHSGSLPKIMEMFPKIKIIISPNGLKGIQRHYYSEWDCQVVNSGDELNTGKYNLKFAHIPMVHWPDSMVTYIPQEELLFSNDAFGQHIASATRFDAGLGWDIANEEAAKYYANIVFPYGDQVNKALDVVENLPVQMIAPSHGLIWKFFIPNIIKSYRRWASNQTDIKALIVYDTMWGSTKTIASALQEGLEEAGVPVTLKFLQTSHMSDIVPDILTSKAVLVGSPTLNNGMLPSIAGFLAYIKGLRPKKRIGFAFGSFGWGGQGAVKVREELQSMGWEMPGDVLNIKYRPAGDEIEEAKMTGFKLGQVIKNGD